MDAVKYLLSSTKATSLLLDVFICIWSFHCLVVFLNTLFKGKQVPAEQAGCSEQALPVLL